jgi:hypothetical protein
MDGNQDQTNTTRIWVDESESIYYNTRYYYRIRAWNQLGFSAYSPEQNLTTPLDPSSNPPQASGGGFVLKAFVAGSDLIRLEWTDVDHEDGYFPAWRVHNVPPWNTANPGIIPNNLYMYYRVTPGVNYDFKVTASNSKGSIDSNIVAAEIPVDTQNLGGLRIKNNTSYDAYNLRLGGSNGTDLLTQGEYILPHQYWDTPLLNPGSTTLYVDLGIAPSDDQFFYYSSIPVTVTAGENNEVNIDLTAGQVLHGTFHGTEWGDLDFPEHQIVFNANGSFTRSFRRGTGSWSVVQTGSIVVTNWPNYGGIEFTLNSGGPYCIISLPFQTLYSRISVVITNGSVELGRQ